jgi:hypothetical protein
LVGGEERSLGVGGREGGRREGVLLFLKCSVAVVTVTAAVVVKWVGVLACRRLVCAKERERERERGGRKGASEGVGRQVKKGKEREREREREREARGLRKDERERAREWMWAPLKKRRRDCADFVL